MDQPRYTGLGGQTGDSTGALGMGRLEGGATAFRQDSRQIDHPFGALDGARDRGFVGRGGRQSDDLPHITHGFEEHRRLGIAHRYAHHIAALRQTLNDIASNKARPAENRRNSHVRHIGVSRDVFAAVFWHGKSYVKSP